jgi:malto-oligosyltrehalose trehalohydrolase
MPCGAEVTDGGTRFRLWAPGARRVALKIQINGEWRHVDLPPASDGWHELTLSGIGAGARYRYLIDDESDVPDPASRFNPQGVQGPCEVVDRDAFEWRDDGWRGREWHEAVLYEMHIGTFTREGTYAAAIARLDELAELGITAIEVMPLNTFPGRWGWGYDGVLLYAPHPAYGRPEELKQFVQAAHERGLMLLLDVVYNHFGPEGNYLGRYAPDFFAPQLRTPWGSAINFAHPVVRRFFIDNALYWLEEFRFDGLRIDAVHAMHDEGDTHFIDEVVDTVQRGPGSRRHVHIVLENHRNESRRLGRKGNVVVAQWNDDFHHPLHVIATGENDGYYADYADRPLDHLGRVLAEGFAYQGEQSRFGKQARGEPSGELPPTAFVNFLQNHDQIGNRACGERLAHIVPPHKLRASLVILLLAPQIPMLFMGEEYAASQPFLYFCDYHGELGRAISEGRRKEFAAFASFGDEQRLAAIPDPNDASTYEASRLDHDEKRRAPHSEWLNWTRELLQVRTRKIVPLIPRLVAGQGRWRSRGTVLAVDWQIDDGSTLALHANLGDDVAEPVEPADGETLFRTTPDSSTGKLQAWEVRVLLRRS